METDTSAIVPVPDSLCCIPDSNNPTPKIFLREDSPIAGLSSLFPSGLPVPSSEPNLMIDGWDCYEVLPGDFDPVEVVLELSRPDTPDFCRVWLERSILAVPSEWVQVAA